MGTENQHLSGEGAHRVAAQAIVDADVIEYTAEGCRIATAIAQQAVDVHNTDQWRVYARSVVLVVKPADRDIIREVVS